MNINKSIGLIFIAFVFLVSLLSGCAPAPTPVSPTLTLIPPTLTPKPTESPTVTPVIYNVKINVVDTDGNPISKAKIIQGVTIEFTDDQGNWQISTQSSDLSISVWAQGYLLQNVSVTLQSGDNIIPIQLSTDPLGLQISDLQREGYELVFVEDFQDSISDCVIDGNGIVSLDNTNPENYLLEVDLRNIEEGFSCSFGPTNIENAILEVSFRYPEIQYNDFKLNEYYHWQGYSIQFRDGFGVGGYPLEIPWGATLQIWDSTKEEMTFPVTSKQSIQENRWYELSTIYDGETVEVRMNGSLRFKFLNAPTMSNSKPSNISAHSEAFIQFDNIKMWILKN